MNISASNYSRWCKAWSEHFDHSKGCSFKLGDQKDMSSISVATKFTRRKFGAAAFTILLFFHFAAAALFETLN